MLQLGNKPTLVFVDEFDKLFISGNSNSSAAHESSTGVQNEFLKVLESSTSSVYGDYGKFIPANMKNTLFVFAGAFNNEPDITIDRLRELGIKTEFLGRVGLVYNTAPTTLESLYRILEASPLLAKYLTLFANVNREEVVTLMKDYITRNFAMNTVGARMVNTIIHQYFIKGHLKEEEVKTVTFQQTLSLP
jgi:ATP-dependent protease Clp ATPase subunit